MTSVKVLVADDDTDLRQTLADTLRQHGLQVIEASDGVEALLYTRRIRPDAMILDVTMPRLGGLDIVKHIRRFDPTIRIVVITGLMDAEITRRALAMGAVAVLEKPIAMDALVRAVTHDIRRDPQRPPGVIGSALVVDDDADVVQILDEFLRERGFDVRTAADGGAALRALRERAPDVMLLDIHMPGLTGIYALPAIRALAPHTMVIMVTGEADLQTAALAFAYGAFDLVAKPISFGHLAQSVDNAMALKQLQA